MKTASKRNARRQANLHFAPLPPPGGSLAVAVLIGIALISSPAAAVSPAPPPPAPFVTLESGRALWDDCRDPSSGPAAQLCSAYIAGATDGVLVRQPPPQPAFCLARDVQAEDLALTVRRYLAAHRELQGQPAAFPCSHPPQR
jgi:hypothetical protein